ncbi:MAG: energy transducer TonB [Bacteroidetes bacterium]|nr:energy transducer TonB [Bacteroidota bacterium]
MELKKNPKADLERKRGLYLQIGYLFALAVIFIAFEWKSYDDNAFNLGSLQDNLEEEIIPITEQEQKPPPPPPPAVQELNIVENTEELKEELQVQSTEVTEETKIEPVIEKQEEVVEEDVVFQIVEDMPTFGKGDADVLKYLAENIRYPQVAKELGISGMVFVEFVVDKTGKIKDSKVVRGIGGGCDEEALRVIKGMPAWTPGKQRGKPVSVQFRLPVRFVLK